jgi:hypothetical protein
MPIQTPQTIATPSNQGHKIFVPPNIDLSAKPLNAPSDEQIERWHDLAVSETFYKQKDIDPKSDNAKYVFKPIHLYPLYTDADVLYRYEVAVFCGKDDDKKWKQVMVDVGPEMPKGRPYAIVVPCKDFLDHYVAIM